MKSGGSLSIWFFTGLCLGVVGALIFATGIYEIMTMAPPVRALVSEQADLAQLRKAALRHGMSPLRISGAEKIAAGLTSVDEVLRVTPPAPSARPGR